MGREGDKAVDKLVDAFRVFFVGAVLIVVAYLVIKSLLQTAGLPSWIIYIIIGLLVFFVYIMRDKVIEFTKKILK